MPTGSMEIKQQMFYVYDEICFRIYFLPARQTGNNNIAVVGDYVTTLTFVTGRAFFE